MIDITKVADLVLLLIDASFGFEMEIFEFLNICQASLLKLISTKRQELIRQPNSLEYTEGCSTSVWSIK